MDDIGLTDRTILPCAHIFCRECVIRALKTDNVCPLCRRPTNQRDIFTVAPPESKEDDIDVGDFVVDAMKQAGTLQAAASSSAAAAASASASSSKAKVATPVKSKPLPKVDDKIAAGHGTKTAHIIRTLHAIRANDPDSKAILFCQFDDLKRVLSTALNECGIKHCVLQGSTLARANLIRSFNATHVANQKKENIANNVEEDPREKLLLLSLEDSASGSNLTAASHVLFVHPMLAANQETAIAYEAQAVGRVRRPGQEKTVDEKIDAKMTNNRT